MYFVIVQGTQVERHDQKLLRFKTDIDHLRVMHTSKEQPCSHERNQCESHFRDHQNAAQLAARPGSTPASASRIQRCCQISFGGRDCGSQTKKNSSQQRKSKSKQQDMRIEGKVEIISLDERRPIGP